MRSNRPLSLGRTSSGVTTPTLRYWAVSPFSFSSSMCVRTLEPESTSIFEIGTCGVFRVAHLSTPLAFAPARCGSRCPGARTRSVRSSEGRWLPQRGQECRGSKALPANGSAAQALAQKADRQSSLDPPLGPINSIGPISLWTVLAVRLEPLGYLRSVDHESKADFQCTINVVLAAVSDSCFLVGILSISKRAVTR